MKHNVRNGVIGLQISKSILKKHYFFTLYTCSVSMLSFHLKCEENNKNCIYYIYLLNQFSVNKTGKLVLGPYFKI